MEGTRQALIPLAQLKQVAGRGRAALELEPAGIAHVPCSSPEYTQNMWYLGTYTPGSSRVRSRRRQLSSPASAEPTSTRISDRLKRG